MPSSRSRVRVAAPLCQKAAAAPGVAAAGLTFPGAYRPRARSFVAEKRYRRFQQVVAGLRSCCPPAFPVIVRTASLAADIEGTCTRRRNCFVIKIADRLDEKTAVEVLIHEWSHALAWNHRLDAVARDPPEDKNVLERISHGAEWGVAYAMVWRIFTTKILPGVD